MATAQRIAACLNYDGSSYHGWQNQPNQTSVQAQVEAALSRIDGSAVKVVASGRTDSGVHAIGQLVHADITNRKVNWLRALNTFLPNDIRCTWFAEVDSDFHARFSAQKRTYVYLVAPEPLSFFWMNRAKGINHAVDVDAMNDAAQFLVGEHDFGSFRASNCSALHAVRRVYSAHWHCGGNGVMAFRITATAFLLRMVRILVGTLLEVGAGRRAAEEIKELLASPDRNKAGRTASPHGLYLAHTEYPEKYGIPIPPLPWTHLPRVSF